jgi:hypothetical protein
VAVGLRGVYPTEHDRLLDAMPASWRREEDRVKFIVVERDGVDGERQSIGVQIEESTPTTRRIFRRAYAKRTPELDIDDIESDLESDSESEDEDDRKSNAPPSRPFTIPSATPTGIPAVRMAWYYCSNRD